MTRILTIIALLFATPAWAGEVDGNSFYCKPIGDSSDPYAVRLANGKASRYWHKSYVLPEENYRLNHTFVVWGSDAIEFRLNRKTLILQGVLSEKNKVFQSLQCEFMDFEKGQKAVNEFRNLKKKEMLEGNQF
jgi:hypothetical protein